MRRGNERGQSLVLVALSLTVLLGATAVAIDAGQFFSERRFLQNAADAAALAAATAISQGRSVADAEAAARDTLTRNFAQAPTPTHPPMPSTIPIYAAGHVVPQS